MCRSPVSYHDRATIPFGRGTLFQSRLHLRFGALLLCRDRSRKSAGMVLLSIRKLPPVLLGEKTLPTLQAIKRRNVDGVVCGIPFEFKRGKVVNIQS